MKYLIELFKVINTNVGDSTLVFIGAQFEPSKMHIYSVKTTGRHPVHIIEGGDIITEDERVFDESSDLGWFWLNQKEYNYFKSQCKEINL